MKKITSTPGPIIGLLIATALCLLHASAMPAAAADRGEVQVSYDPTWSKTSGYADYRAAAGAPAPLEMQLIAHTRGKGTGNVLLIIESSLVGSVSLDSYWLDLQAAGYSVSMYTCYGGTPANLRSYLQTEYQSNGLAGVILIGDLPVPWFEIDYDFDGPDPDELDNEYVDFPCDLFYMDLDGTWEDNNATPPFQVGVYDTHTDGSGDREPEIWVGRLTSSPMTFGSATEADLLNEYFAKNRLFRTGGLYAPERALVYVDDDWYDTADHIDSCAALAYGDRTMIKEKTTTCSDDYRDARFSAGYEWMHVMLHSSSSEHYFKINDAWEMDGASLATVDNHDVWVADPFAIFYNLYACSNCRYTETDYMGGWYIFGEEHGLLALGTTKIGGMWDNPSFYTSLAAGHCLGQAFTDWLSAQAPFDADDVRWYYGMTLLGDATLTLRPQLLTQAPAQHALGTAHHPSLTIALDHDMRAASFNSTSFPVHGSQSGRHIGSYSYDPATRTCAFQSTDGFIDGEVVTAGFSRRVVSSDNIPSRGRTWSFTVGVGNPTAGDFIEGDGFSFASSEHIHTSDFNGDGYPDVATTSYISGTDGLYIGLNAGDGTFLTPQTCTSGAPDPRWIASGDFNGDGDIDLAVTNSTSTGYGTEVSVFTNNGSGWFSGPVNYYSHSYPGPVIAGDFDGDADIDLVVIAGGFAHNLDTYWNDGSGTFSMDYQTTRSGEFGLRLQGAGDIDNDGDLDLYGARTDGYGDPNDSLAVLFNDGSGRFTYACVHHLADGPGAICANDFDGDGDLDFAVASVYAYCVEVLHNAGDGTIAAAYTLSSPATSAFTICCGDWDGDGDIDLANGARHPSYTVCTFQNNGDGTFGSAETQATKGPYSMISADFDRDGDLDLALAVSATIDVLILENDGGPDFTAPARAVDLTGTATMSRAAAMVYWTAPGDDGGLGCASAYDLRYSATPVGSDTLAWWNAATPAPGEPDPSLAGCIDSCGLSDLDPDTIYYLILRAADEVPNWSGYSNVLALAPASADAPDHAGIPSGPKLYASAPNPCREGTTIRYDLSQPAVVDLTIFDVTGRTVRMLVDGVPQEPGSYPAEWDRRDDAGRAVAAGLYFYRIKAGSLEQSRRLVCVR